MPQNGTLTLTVQPVTATATLVLGNNPSRNYLCIQNIGANDMQFGFTPSFTNGITLSPGGAGNQGGFFIWEKEFVPTNSIYVLSASTSTTAILEG